MNINKEANKIKASLLNVIVQNWFCYLYLKDEYKKELAEHEAFDAEKNVEELGKVNEVVTSLEQNNKKGKNNSEITKLKAKAVELNQEAGDFMGHDAKRVEVDKYWNNVRESLFQFNHWDRGISDVKAMIDNKEMIKK